jgi:hypothetical protein
MAFTPISLPIQQILMTNFVTDIATITNANTLLLQAKLEDLINDLEIDISNLSIGTDTPINYLKAQTVILQDTGLLYQTGLPTPTVIASLTKNISNESIFQVDRLITNTAATFNAATLNNLTINTSAIFNGTSTFNAPLTIASSVIESKESITTDFTWDGTAGSPAAGSITLSSTSKQNIFVTLKASTAPATNPIYDGTNINASISSFELTINFDSVSPPAQNTVFTIYFVDVVDSSLNSIKSPVQLAAIPIKILAGTNLLTSSAITLHDGISNVGLSSSSDFNEYSSNVTFTYILDSSSADRLIASGLVGASLF